MNLGTETRDAILDEEYNLNDVVCVEGWDGCWTLENFLKIADTINYNNGYGAVQISAGLTIYLSDDSYFKREEYDGSEWWEYVPRFHAPTPSQDMPTLKDIIN